MKKVKMKVTVDGRKKGRICEVTDRYADILVEKGKADYADKQEKEEKAEPETKELKAKTITKAVD